MLRQVAHGLVKERFEILAIERISGIKRQRVREIKWESRRCIGFAAVNHPWCCLVRQSGSCGARLHPAEIAADAIKPGIKAIRVAQGGKLTPGSH
jgi:hypothetical protein